MDKIKLKIEKNKLDLMYQKYLQQLNAILAFGTVGVLTIIAAIINIENMWRKGIIIIVTVAIIAVVWYIILNKKMNDLLNQIGALGK